MELLVVVRGRDGAAAVYRFAGPEVQVGRDEARQIILPDPGVSGLHARLVRDGEGWWVMDAGSTHGTRVGGEPLAAGERRRLVEGDGIKVGPFLLEICFDGSGGLTTESKDSRRLADLLAASAKMTLGDSVCLWVEQGLCQDTSLALPPASDVWLGADLDCHLVLPDAPTGLRVQVTRGPRGPWFRAVGGAVGWRGRRAREGPLGPEDRLRLGPVVVGLRGTPAPRPAPPAPRTRPWTLLERVALGVGLTALLSAAWLALR